MPPIDFRYHAFTPLFSPPLFISSSIFTAHYWRHCRRRCCACAMLRRFFDTD
jgi:hypothetical protein